MLVLGLAACGLGVGGPDTETEAANTVEPAVMAAVPDVNGVFVTTAWDGPADRTMRVRLYVNSTDPFDPVESAMLADTVDRAASAAWASTPIAIVRLTIEAVAGQRPDSPPGGVEQVIDLTAAGEQLGIDPRQFVDGRIVLPESSLIERYGSPGLPAPAP